MKKIPTSLSIDEPIVLAFDSRLRELGLRGKRTAVVGQFMKWCIEQPAILHAVAEDFRAVSTGNTTDGTTSAVAAVIKSASVGGKRDEQWLHRAKVVLGSEKPGLADALKANIDQLHDAAVRYERDRGNAPGAGQPAGVTEDHEGVDAIRRSIETIESSETQAARPQKRPARKSGGRR